MVCLASFYSKNYLKSSYLFVIHEPISFAINVNFYLLDEEQQNLYKAASVIQNAYKRYRVRISFIAKGQF